MSSRLPRVSQLEPDKSGWGYFLCVRKDVRVGKNGEYLALILQDASGTVAGRVFDGVDRLKGEFEVGEFVRAEGRTSVHNGELQLVASSVRRINPAQDEAQGFREEDCIPSAPRPVGDMWAELTAMVEAVAEPSLRVFLSRILADHGPALQEWPAAQQIHHAYRGGLLEHVITMAGAGRALARIYGAREDLLVAGALIHDIGKLQELAYDNGAISYTRDGNLIGHIALGLVLVRETAKGINGFPDDLRAELEHLVVSHHGARDRGSPVEPKSVEAFILAAVDDLDARLHQVRRATGDGDAAEFTAWHKRLGRVLYRGLSPSQGAPRGD
jgi:3'-5' exoribonuclease